MSKPTDRIVDRLTAPEESGLDPALLVPLLRLLALGDPVEINDLAAVTGRTAAEVRAGMEAVADTEYDDAGRVVGQALTLRPTAHRFTVDSRELYTWCALDTLMFPALIEATASVESTSPVSGEPVRLTAGPTQVSDVEPASAVVSLVDPADMSALRSSFCTQVHFFTSAEDARPWLAEHPDATVVPVAEAFRLGHALTSRLLTGATDPTGDLT